MHKRALRRYAAAAVTAVAAGASTGALLATVAGASSTGPARRTGRRQDSPKRRSVTGAGDAG